MQTMPPEVWLIILGIFSAFMLILIEVNLYVIVGLLRQLRDRLAPPDDI